MLGAVKHQGSHHVPKSQLSSKCRLFRTGWQNPEINNKPTQIEQPPSAAAMEKPHFQDVNPLQDGCLGMQVPHKSVLKEPLTLVLLSPTLSHSAGLEQLWRMAVTGHDLSGQSSTRDILLPLSGEGCTYCIPSLQRLASLPKLLDLWHPGYGCGALQGQQCHCPWENGSCITGLWALPSTLSCPDTTPAPLLHAQVGN